MAFLKNNSLSATQRPVLSGSGLKIGQIVDKKRYQDVVFDQNTLQITIQYKKTIKSKKTYSPSEIHQFPSSERAKLQSVHQIFHEIHPDLACIMDPKDSANQFSDHTGFPLGSHSNNVYGSVLCHLCSQHYHLHNSVHV